MSNAPGPKNTQMSCTWVTSTGPGPEPQSRPAARSTPNVVLAVFSGTHPNVPWHQVKDGPTCTAMSIGVPVAAPVRRSTLSVDLVDRSSGVGNDTPNQPPSAAATCTPPAPSVWKSAVGVSVPAFACQLPGAQPSRPSSNEDTTIAAAGSGLTVTVRAAWLDSRPAESRTVYGTDAVPW